MTTAMRSATPREITPRSGLPAFLRWNVFSTAGPRPGLLLPRSHAPLGLGDGF
jgi:hypothetical protein